MEKQYDLNEVVNEAVRSFCTQIRAMDKEMRIFCAELLTKLQGIPESTVV